MNRAQARRHLARRQRRDRLFFWLFLAATLLGVAVLAVLLLDTVSRSWGWLSWHFLNRFPSRFPDQAGLKSALYGTVWLVTLTALFSFPLGVGAAIYLEEFAPRRPFTGFIQTNIMNLAGVPSIVYGILGLALFVRTLALGRSVLAGALTMTLLVLPIIIVASQEALRSVPLSLRHASIALGATRWQAVRDVVVPAAMPGILTGSILAMSRAMGETAPLIMMGAMTFVPFVPQGPLDMFTVLPIQIYSWASRPQPDFQSIAAAGIVVMLAVQLTVNGFAIWLRQRLQRRSQL